MSSEIIDSSLGRSQPGEPSSDSDVPAVAPSAAAGGTGTASVDELVLALSQVSPDPYLDEFQPEPPRAAAAEGLPPQAEAPTRAIGAAALGGLDLDVPPSAELVVTPDSASGVAAVVAALDLHPTERTASQDPARASASASSSPVPGTAEQFAALDLYAPPPSKAETLSTRTRKATSKAEDEDEDEDDNGAPYRVSLPFVLLASYASAVTLGLIWVLWGNRVARDTAGVETDAFPAAESTVDPGQRAGQSRRYVPPAPLAADRIVTLGQTIRIDLLEVTPLAVASGPVTLRHTINEGESRQGGNDALTLALRLKNCSGDSILIPLDEAFMRSRARDIRDSFIEAGPTRQIDMFPLAVESEWAIAGQEFRELNPGASFDTVVVSAPDALSHLAPEMTWRLRLRTDINKTDTLGIRFREQDIRRTPRRSGPERREQSGRSSVDDKAADSEASQ